MAPIDFRRIDVDQYDEDRLDPVSLYHPDPRAPSQVLADAQQTDKQVRGLVQRGDLEGALREALTEGRWPYGEDAVPEIRQAKTTALATVLSILNSTRSTDIPNLVQQLSPDQHLLLMKYLYKAMENLGADTSGNVVLGWHEKVRFPLAWLVVGGLKLGGRTRGFFPPEAAGGSKDCASRRAGTARSGRLLTVASLLTKPRALSVPSAYDVLSCAAEPAPFHLLQLTEVAGIGCIVRVMSDRRRV
ncbi:hypothetical protein BMF94_6701 [Rhodotorula taiwanensis]|uniref:Actin-related protein 2/3 complex subunit 5 n=1 Tax=Rhodotorula taiwanensis TaxID=741276 RepID=A0A2S5B0I6_9BASI|nr:hypothetical protein BMF94_6701 [Rhodotorula taiwanensis]